MYKNLVFLLSTVALSLGVAASPLVSRGDLCAGETTVSETYIGANKDVKLEQISCAAGLNSRALEARQTNNGTNVCGANLLNYKHVLGATHCFTPSGGGPDPNDCHVIADALRFEGANTGALFQIANGTSGNVVTLTYHSCESFFVNQDLGPLVYCRDDWAAVIDFVAPNCQATQNAHGGLCLASDQRWFIQVQHA
ncbi:hypothetical protein K435DRAFT_838230 [Dendrothele bispora CBS 962.96]|uniref:Uncharacterized protein n=1 Tax=Dendrothele bispora (strain CBS 962.96) TaxID=1314807 RepID=A0A4S8M7S1_DENBC|nr:hypothetical protein K435DRAFT_838230 [Dendrothele bispora CBS 962.96]